MESVAAQIRANFAALGALSSALSLLDVLCAFAVRVMSSKGAYVRPVFGDDESPLAVEVGRYLSFYLFSVLLACCASIWAKSVENVRKSVSRVCCSPTAGARCQEAPLACRPHSLAPRECGRPTRPIRLDAALAVGLQQTRRRACHRRRPVGGDGV